MPCGRRSTDLPVAAFGVREADPYAVRPDGDPPRIVTDLPASAQSVPARLGVTARIDDGTYILDLTPTPEVLHHGAVRASVLAYVIDAVTGIAVDGGDDVWTLTSDLSVRAQLLPAPEQISAVGTVLREGRRSVTCGVELTTPDGEVVAVGAAGFARIPRKPTDPPKPIVSPEDTVLRFRNLATLSAPLRDEAGVEVLDAANGVVQVEVTPELRNPNGTLQGAMVALVAEAGVEELISTRFDVPAVVTDLDLRYLARAEVGPVRSTCRLVADDPEATVEVRLVDVSTGTTTTLVYARAARASGLPCA